MPYYLVTHTSLVEGENEVKAAQMVLAKLKADHEVQFLVKFDEATIHTVKVATDIASIGKLVDWTPMSREPANTSDTSRTEHDERMPAVNRKIPKRCWVVGAGLFTAGLLLGSLIALVH